MVTIPQHTSHTSLANRRSSSFFNTPVAPPQPDVYYVGVDVGTGSARACLIDTNGIILGLAERPITRHELKPNHITQSSTEIWNAICYCVNTCIRDSGVDPSEVFGIGFDATCSLVAISESTDEPVAVGPDFTDHKENIILWMDHRAVDETNAINATGDKSLKYVGGQMSIEMELPKIKWLKHNLPGGISDCKFYDLGDYLTHKATGSEARSFCSAVCKQGFVSPGVEGSETGWSEELLLSVDLPELVEDNFRRLGGIPGKNGVFLSAGDIVGKLTADAAAQLGLTTECIVGSAVIDAYAGWIGTVAAKADIAGLQNQDSDSNIEAACGRLAAVAGTSTCHIAMTKEPCFVKGVWGPYKDVMAPGYWLAEGGQSMTGALLAHVLAIHPASQELARLAEASNVSKFDYLNLTLENLVTDRNVRSVVSLAKHMFFYGDFHGNRSPIADPNMKANIIGQSMDSSVNDLAIQYFGACEFIAQQTRQIVEEMEKSGHEIGYIYMSGGQCRNGLLMRLLADCTGKPIIIPRYIDAAVVFGSAILGAVAAEDSVSEHISTRGRSRRSSILQSQRSGTNLSLGGSQPPARDSSTSVPPAHSPYTAPSATASSSNVVSLAYASSGSGSHHHIPAMTPMEEEQVDYFNQPTAPANLPTSDIRKSVISSDDDDSGDELSFGSKSKVQQDLQQKFHKLGLKPLSTIRKVSSNNPVQKVSPEDKLWKVMEKMTGPGRVIPPSDKNDPDRRLLAAKYEIFLEQCFQQRRYRDIVDQVEVENIKATGSTTVV
ncbi:ribitol kinase [Scheffersomyces amazonensis]|uniref:ribitol kinase n=1 Tax=Scheffersomyces amazonensis TaxID=1078765 RepID=UPI00315CCCD1